MLRSFHRLCFLFSLIIFPLHAFAQTPDETGANTSQLTGPDLSQLTQPQAEFLEKLHIQAWDAYSKNNYPQAIDLATELADNSDFRGHFILGTMVFRGEGVAEDKQRGMALIYAAATKGYAHAQLAVAAVFHRGLMGDAPDVFAAMPWYQLAADQGLPQAQTMLGIHYFRGDVLERDMEKARGWLMMAAAQRYDAALMALAQIHLDDAPERALIWMLVMRRIKNNYLTNYAADNISKVLPHLTASEVITAQDKANQWLDKFVPDALSTTEAGEMAVEFN